MLNPTSPLPLKDPTLFRQANCIDGKWVQADSGQTIVVKNPATGEAIGEVPALGAAETRRAIEAAHRAQAAWRAMLAKDRAAILRKLNDLMLANADDLAVIMTAEQGKPLAESKGEIAYAASFIEWFAEEGKRIYGDTIPQNAKGRRILVLKEPIGVFAAITPWNFPAAMITRKAGPGWAAGCTGVIRPASQTPFSALALAVLAERAGMPPGVCNVITGPSGETGARTDLQPAGAQADLHRLAPRSAPSCWRSARRPSRRPAWNWAATRRSSCSTTPISTPRWRARWPASTATPARPASAPTASWCRTASTTHSPPS